MNRRIASVLAVLSCIASVGACGGDDDATAPSATVGAPAEDTTARSTTIASSAAPTTTAAIATSDSGADRTTAGAGSTPEQDFVDAFANNYGLFDDEAQDACVGQTFVDLIGYEQLAASGVAPDDIIGVVTLDQLGLVATQDAVPGAIDQLAGCGDLVAVSLEVGGGTPEQQQCAREVITNELTAEQLIVQVTGLQPSAELTAARVALEACSAG